MQPLDKKDRSRLWELRGKYKLSQKYMAQLLGITLNTYNQKEVGNTDFKETEMITIREFFKAQGECITLDDLFKIDVKK